MEIDGAPFTPIFVARQAVFDRSSRVWGYELLFRHSAESCGAVFSDPDSATAQVIVDGFALAQSWLQSGQRVLINFPEKLLLDGLAMALPPETAVIEILEDVRPTPAILEVCRGLKREGYLLALDDVVGIEGFEPLIALADIIKIDIQGVAPESMACLVSKLRTEQAKILLAEKVENQEQLEAVRQIGFNFFQGYFFSRPQIFSGKKLAANQLSKLQLIRELNRAGSNLHRLGRIIKNDVSLSYRLLRYINSASVGLASPVSAITHAVVMLGLRRISAWLKAIVLADLNPSPRAAEVMFLSLQRARFLELLGERFPRSSMPAETMFLLGLFSFLETLLSQPMQTLVPLLNLEPCLASGLLGKEDSESGILLRLLEDSEQGRWESMEATLKHLEIDSRQAAVIMSEAVLWARQFLTQTQD